MCLDKIIGNAHSRPRSLRPFFRRKERLHDFVLEVVWDAGIQRSFNHFRVSVAFLFFKIWRRGSHILKFWKSTEHTAIKENPVGQIGELRSPVIRDQIPANRYKLDPN